MTAAPTARPGAKRAAEKASFWIIEGIATYFETMNEHRDAKAGLYYTIGQSSEGRLPAAREHLLKGHEFIPRAQLTNWGRLEMQAQPNLRRVYWAFSTARAKWHSKTSGE